MIRWRPENAGAVATWKMAMVLSRGYERILIGPNQEIKRVLSGKSDGNVHSDVTRPMGSFLIGFDDDRSEAMWRNALHYLRETQEMSLSQRILHLLDKESIVVSLEEKAQSILQEKYDTGDPICQYVALRIWYGYWCIREKVDHSHFEAYFSRIENLIRPFYRCDVTIREDRRILPEDPIFRWPAILEDCDSRMVLYNQRLKGTDTYIVVDDSLIPMKQYYTDSLAKWKLCIIQCKMCGKFFVDRSLHHRYCGESCRRAAQIMHREKRMEKEACKDIEKLCRNEYAYWYNRCRKAKGSGVWTEDALYDLESAFLKFKEGKVKMRQKHKKGSISAQELHSWFLSQRNIVDALMEKH